MATMYHVAGEKYEVGDPLLPFNALLDMGILCEEDWQWEDAELGFDGDVVCLYASRDEATEHMAIFGGAIILAVNIPDDEEEFYPHQTAYGTYITPRMTRVDEGFVAMERGIPAEWIEVA